MLCFAFLLLLLLSLLFLIFLLTGPRLILCKSQTATWKGRHILGLRGETASAASLVSQPQMVLAPALQLK